MDYFQNTTDLTDEELQCVAESLVHLPVLSQNNSRDEIQDHLFSSLFEKGAMGDTFDKIQASVAKMTILNFI